MAHWGYENPLWPSFAYQFDNYGFILGYKARDFSGEALSLIIADNVVGGYGCAIARPYTMFQQHMPKSFSHDGYYYVSGYIKKSDSGHGTSTDDYIISWILSEDQPSYVDESCGALDNLGNTNYNKINNVDFGSGYGPDIKLNIPIAISDPAFDEWKYVEKEVFVGHRQNLSWLSVNVGLTNDNDTRENDPFAPYFGFDNLYVSDKECSCPIIRLLQNQLLQAPNIIRAQQYIRAGYDVGNVGTNHGAVTIVAGGSGKTEFRAGNFVSLEPGFSVENGAIFEVNIKNCFDAPAPINLVFRTTAYTPNCDGLNEQFCFDVENATSFIMHVYNSWGQQIADMSSTISVEPGAHHICLDIPLDIPGDHTYTYFLDLFGCQDQTLSTVGAFSVFGATVGCYAAKTNDLIRHNSNTQISRERNSNPNEDFKIFPDPACQSIQIQYSNYNESDVINISDVEGKLLQTFSNFKDRNSFDISYLTNGVYYVSYFSNGNLLTRKFVKLCQ